MPPSRFGSVPGVFLMSAAADISIAPFTNSLLDAAWQLRLRALHDHPDAFGQPWESARQMSHDDVVTLSETFWTGGDNQVFLALDPDGAPLGMLGIARESRTREQHRSYIWGVYVDPQYRSLGISSRLIEAAITHARTLDGVLQIQLTVNSANHPAVNAYRKLGFHTWGTMPRASMLDGLALDLDHMVLMLD